jgi:NADH-quinone oxidoreductase subunit F
MADVRGVASYYSLLSLEPRGAHVIRLCVSPVCRMMGSLDLLDLMKAELGVAIGETTTDGVFSLEACQCLGNCAAAPAMMIDDVLYGGMTLPSFRRIVETYRAAEAGERPGEGREETAIPSAQPHRKREGEKRVTLRYLGLVPPLDLVAYVAAGGFAGLRKALAIPPETLVADFERSGVRGRGGAGFPTGTKERSTMAEGGEAAAAPPRERFVVCNADEGEPGTFKDRAIMENEPFLLLEGMLVSAHAIGAKKGYLYVRGEYGLSIRRLEEAIAVARTAGILGPNALGPGRGFEIELRKGSGSYLCGEELTLLESLEGRRGHPRIKPPFPAEAGLFGAPTLVNNVETLANLPWIVERGVEAYRALGTPSSPGSKIFCLCGDIVRPGFVEFEMGVSLRELVDDIGRGVRGGGAPQAVLLGGAAGTFVPGTMLDLVMDFDELRKAGLSLGSGAVIVIGKERSLASVLRSLMDFFAHESCGKCVPCRVGTARLAKAAAVLEAAPREERAGLLAAMVAEAELMAKTSLCPLGQSPIMPLRSLAARLSDRI